MEHDVAAATAQFRGSAACGRWALQLSSGRRSGPAGSASDAAEPTRAAMSQAEIWLKEPWSNPQREGAAAKFGIWVFLASEMLFFGALLLTYTACRIEDPQAFAMAGRETNVWFGT